MSLETTLTDIVGRLRQGRFPNEQAISQGAVLRVLQELDWDIYDTTAVWPEFQTGEGRADFALCHPPSTPAVFIEVKAPGKAEDGIRQALEYAFHTGAPFVVLTDGRTWSFYLPAEQGSYQNRRVHKLDLFELPPAEAAEMLSCYLAHSRVVSGEALEMARREYRSRHRRIQARAAIPGAWRALVEKGHQDLVNMLAAAVEFKAGIRPDDEDVAQFLAKLGHPAVVETGRAKASAQLKAVIPHPSAPRSSGDSANAHDQCLSNKDFSHFLENRLPRTQAPLNNPGYNISGFQNQNFNFVCSQISQTPRKLCVLSEKLGIVLLANVRMSARVHGGYLLVKFEGGSSQQWPLTPKSDPEAIRRTQDEAVLFAEQNDATDGQINALKKAFVDARYCVSM